MILGIEREWAKWPGWFATLDRETQTELLVDWNVRHAPRR